MKSLFLALFVVFTSLSMAQIMPGGSRIGPSEIAPSSFDKSVGLLVKNLYIRWQMCHGAEAPFNDLKSLYQFLLTKNFINYLEKNDGSNEPKCGNKKEIDCIFQDEYTQILIQQFLGLATVEQMQEDYGLTYDEAYGLIQLLKIYGLN